MRVNFPVTESEVVVPAGGMLVSVTDLKGRISYCNDTFVEISGYSRAELMGQPHNIVRHPDMPAEAYRDLWDTLGRGQQWIGIVKNRCKNGDFYWVQANVMPVVEGDAIAGYRSVRCVAMPSQIEEAERLYARMRRERDGRVIASAAASSCARTSRACSHASCTLR